MPCCRRRATAIAVSFGLGTVLVVPQAIAAPPPLPEGDNGIAANYANDQGIGDDPAVLLHEDFEAVAGGSLSSDNSAFESVYGDNTITQTPADVHAGNQAVERTHASPGSFGAVKSFGAGFDALHIRYYLKYHSLYPGCHHTGGGVYAAAGTSYTQIGDITGVPPDGTNHFQAWLDDMAPFFDWSPVGNDEPPGWLHFYCYNMDQASEYGDLLFPDGTIIPGASGINLDPDFESRPNVNPETDRWASYEVMVQANTPGMADGRIAFWVDGQLAGDFPGLRLRSTADLKPNHAALSTYSSQVHENKTLWYDDVVVATEYIGPMFGGGDDGGESSSDGGSDGGADEAGESAGDSAGDSAGESAGDSAGVGDGSGDGGSESSGDSGAGNQDAGGCGCSSRSGGFGASLVGLLALAQLRRRRFDDSR